jgi:hypothetical protein
MTTTLYLITAIRVPHSQNTSASHCPNLVRKHILKNFYGTQLVVNQYRVKVDALGDMELDGEVAEIAASAVTRTGQSIAQTAVADSREAKDFKAVIRLVNLSNEMKDRLRPGMSATATINTDRRHNVIAIPLQVLVERELSQDKLGSGNTAKEKNRLKASSSSAMTKPSPHRSRLG